MLMPLDHGFERTFVTALRGLDIMSSAQKASPVQGALAGRAASGDGGPCQSDTVQS